MNVHEPIMILLIYPFHRSVVVVIVIVVSVSFSVDVVVAAAVPCTFCFVC